MKCFVDGDQVCIVHDDFVNLQESPAVFVPLATELGTQLASGGIDAVTDEAALYLVKSLKLCVMPFGDTWSAFSRQLDPLEDYVHKTNGPTIRAAVLRGALFHDETQRAQHTGLACMLCKSKVVKIVKSGALRCRCQEVPVFSVVTGAVPEFRPSAFPHWFAADLVLDGE